MRDQCRRRRVRDPHLAEGGGIGRDTRTDLVTGTERLVALLGGHGGLGCGVSRPGGDPPRDQPGGIHGAARHSGVHDPQIDAVGPREHVRCGAAGEKVRDHLSRYRLGIGGDPFVSDTVVAGEEGKAAARQARGRRALDTRDLCGPASPRPLAHQGAWSSSRWRAGSHRPVRGTPGKARAFVDHGGLENDALTIPRSQTPHGVILRVNGHSRWKTLKINLNQSFVHSESTKQISPIN